MPVFGQLQQFPIKASFTTSFHFLQVLTAAPRVFSADVAAQTLGAFETFMADMAL